MTEREQEQVHTRECEQLPGTIMSDLTLNQQKAVLSCPHSSHDSVRFLFKTRWVKTGRGVL